MRSASLASSSRIAAAVLALGGVITAHPAAAHSLVTRAAPYAGPTPDVRCRPGSMPETTQGRVPAKDYASGRAANPLLHSMAPSIENRWEAKPCVWITSGYLLPGV